MDDLTDWTIKEMIWLAAATAASVWIALAGIYKTAEIVFGWFHAL